jgi:hypothetical protein
LLDACQNKQEDYAVWGSKPKNNQKKN